MRFVTLGVCLGLVLLAGGCDPVAESKLFREGIGTELTRSGLSEAARAQDEYIGFLCQQSGLEVVRSGDRMRCVAEAVGSRSWELIVQAGMNDIDVRCDAYLAWLDDKRRSQAPLLAQINALNTATESIMIATGSATGSTPLLVVTQAFGLATNTLTNLHSRLLLQVNQSTVQAVVLRGRSDFREDVKSLRIDNRPAAIHVLRSYLNICMPFNIEASINTTVTAYELGGPDALVSRVPMISPDTVQSVRAIEPRQEITKPVRREPQVDERLRDIFDDFNSQVDTVPRLKQVQAALCLSETGRIDETLKLHVRIFEQAYRYPARNGVVRDAAQRRNDRLDQDEIAAILDRKGRCRNAFGKNYFERMAFSTDGVPALLVTELRKFQTLSATPSVRDVRSAIVKVRNDARLVGKVFIPLPDAMLEQVTSDLWEALRDTQP